MRMIILGAPGTGKGTYSKELSVILKLPQISSGDLLRAARNDPRIGSIITKYQDEGLPVPDEVVMPIIEKRLKEGDCKKGFILDAIPYNINQAKMLDKITSIDLVINLILPDSIIVKKNLGRMTCKNCGATYNVAEIKEEDIYMPPLPPKKEGICDKCGGSLIKRSDDTEETVRERLRVYKKRIKPVLEFYINKKIVKEFKVNGSPETVVPQLLELIKSVLGVKKWV